MGFWEGGELLVLKTAARSAIGNDKSRFDFLTFVTRRFERNCWLRQLSLSRNEMILRTNQSGTKAETSPLYLFGVAISL
jgi:hypothetical protein